MYQLSAWFATIKKFQSTCYANRPVLLSDWSDVDGNTWMRNENLRFYCTLTVLSAAPPPPYQAVTVEAPRQILRCAHIMPTWYLLEHTSAHLLRKKREKHTAAVITTAAVATSAWSTIPAAPQAVGRKRPHLRQEVGRKVSISRNGDSHVASYIKKDYKSNTFPCE